MSAAHATGARMVPLAGRVGYGLRGPGVIATGTVEVIGAACFAWAALELARPVASVADVVRGVEPVRLEVDAFPTGGGCVVLVAPGDVRAMLERLAAAGIRAAVVEL